MARQVSVTLRGTSYLISTDASENHLHEAADILDKTMDSLAQSGVRREDQLALFSALMALVDVINQRDNFKNSMHDHTERLRSALDM